MKRLLAAAVALSLSGSLPASARKLDEVMASATLGICVLEDAKPFSDRASNTGIFLDLGNRLADALGVKLNADWLVSDEYIRKKTCDLLPAAALPSDDTLFRTTAWLKVSFVVVSIASHKPILGLADLGAGPVAVLADSYARHVLTEQKMPLRVAFLHDDDIIDAVATGEAAAGIVSLYSLQWYQHTHPQAALRGDPAGAIVPGLDYSAALALRKSDAPLQAKITAALAKLRADNAPAAIFAAYGLSWQAPP